MNKTNKIDLIKFTLNWILFFIIMAGSLYITSIVLTIFIPDNEDFIQLSIEMKDIGVSTFSFLRPFMVLILILFIIEWTLEKFGINLNNEIKSLIKRHTSY